MTKPRILVTGSSGWIGAAVAERMAGEAEVVGLDLLPGPWTSALGDITDSRLIAELVRGKDAVIHIAALHAPHVRVRSEEEFRRTNIDGTAILLQAALRAGVRRFVLTSTTSVYGCTSRAGEAAIWVTENLEPNPEDIYDVTKLEAERLCREAGRARMSTVILRVSRSFPEPDSLVAFYRLYRGVDRRDVAEGHWLAAAVPWDGCEIFNLSAKPVFKPEDAPFLRNDPWPVIDRRAPEVGEVFRRRGWEKPAAIDRVYAIDKAESRLGYHPRYGFREAVADL